MNAVLGSGCKYRLSSGQRFDCTETIINQLLADSYQNHISEWQVTIKMHLVACYKAMPSSPQSMEKLSSTKLVSGTKKFGDHCCKRSLWQADFRDDPNDPCLLVPMP